MARRVNAKTGLYTALALLFLLHNDWWNWRNGTRVLGLPVGLLYHLGFCLAVMLVFLLLVRHAWPKALSAEREGDDG